MQCRTFPARAIQQQQRTAPTTVADDVAELMLARMGFPPTEHNVETVQFALRIPIKQISMAMEKLPRYTLSRAA